MILDFKPAAPEVAQNASREGGDNSKPGASTWSPNKTFSEAGQTSFSNSVAPSQAPEPSPPEYDYSSGHVPVSAANPLTYIATPPSTYIPTSSSSYIQTPPSTYIPSPSSNYVPSPSSTYVPTPSSPYTAPTTQDQDWEVILRELHRNLNELEFARQNRGHRTLNQTARLIHVLFSTSSFRNSESGLREADLEWQASASRVRVQEELVLMGMRKLERQHPAKHERKTWLIRADKFEQTMKASDAVQSSWTNLPVVIMSERLGILGTQRESSLEGLMKGFVILFLIPFAGLVGGFYLCGAVLVAMRRILFGLLHVCTLGRV